MHYEKFHDGKVKCIQDEIPFDLPDGWEWARLQTICEPITDGTHKTPEYCDVGYIFLSSKNVAGNVIDWDHVMYIPENLHKELYSRLSPQRNDILLAKNGTTGAAAIVDRDEVFDIYVTLALIRAVNYIIYPKYLLYTIQSSFIQSFFDSALKGIGVPNLHLEHIRKTLIPISPYSEQKIITEKISTYFQYINNIDISKNTLKSTIQQTKIKILDLAIRGKLVPQNPDDEPASVLLERIKAEKEELIKQGKIKRDKKDSVIFRSDDKYYYERIDSEIHCINEEIPFELPDGWEWCRVRNIANIKGGKRLPKGDIFSDTITDYAYIRVTDMKNNTINTEGLKYISKEIHEKIKSYTISKDDLYITIAGTIGVVGEVPAVLDGMNLTENAVKVCNIQINKTFLCYILLSDFVQNQFEDKTHQVAMPKLALERILSTLIPICSIPEQNRVAQTVKKYYLYLDRIEQSLS